jgi:hypothetical protein
VPSSSRSRPIALSRFDSSNSSVTNAWSRPWSPRNASSVRVAVGEVLAEQVAERGRGLLVGLGGPDQQPVELAPDRVDIDGHPGVLERDEADPEGSLEERRPIVRRSLGDEQGQAGVGQREPLHDDPVALDADDRHGRGPGRRNGRIGRGAGGVGRRERDDGGVLHDQIVRPGRDS